MAPPSRIQVSTVGQTRGSVLVRGAPAARLIAFHATARRFGRRGSAAGTLGSDRDAISAVVLRGRIDALWRGGSGAGISITPASWHGRAQAKAHRRDPVLDQNVSVSLCLAT